MKKILILTAVVALMAMTACNEKPAKQDANGDNATEQVDATKAAPSAEAPEVSPEVKHAEPTSDGKDHVAAEFNTKDYQVRLENLSDGTYRLSLWKAGQDKAEKPDQVAESKQCVLQGGSYLMKVNDGRVFLINGNAGKQEITIMNNKNIIYNGKAVK